MGERFAVIDVETSGLLDFKLPADHASQGRIAAFAMVLLSDTLDPVLSHYALIRPDGWSMSEGATKVNGLTDAYLSEQGGPIKNVLDFYEDVVRQNYATVSFNAQFDMKAIRGEFRRAKRHDLFEKARNVCVMRPLAGIVTGRKWPTLIEACKHFEIPLERPHDALCDAQAIAKLFKEMMARDLCPAPRVHYAKGV